MKKFILSTLIFLSAAAFVACGGEEGGNETVAVTDVTLDKPSAELTVGGTVTLTATVLPDNATNKKVSWKSSDEAVATVSGGVVTAVGDGDATITVTTEDGGKEAECIVTVEGATYGSYGVDDAIESIRTAFYTSEGESDLVLVFTSDKNADPGGDEPETSFYIELNEFCLGETIALDQVSGAEEWLSIYFDLTIGETHYWYEADYIDDNYVDIEAEFRDDVNDEHIDLEVKGGSFKVTKDGDTFTVAIDAQLGDYTIICNYSGEPEFVIAE